MSEPYQFNIRISHSQGRRWPFFVQILIIYLRYLGEFSCFNVAYRIFQ
jgi:hypothetical protein